MTFSNGTFEGDTAEQILESMVAEAKIYWGEDLQDHELATIRLIYRPIAEKLALIQEDIGLLLEAHQLDFAAGDYLDLLTALIGVDRDPAKRATGRVEFSRSDAASQDYTIPEGTEVQTDSNDPVTYQTIETVTLSSGTTQVSASVESLGRGVDQNASKNTVTILANPPAGVESVNNPDYKMTGGADEEGDEALRTRAKEELANGSRSSAPALINAVKDINLVTSVGIKLETPANSTNLPGDGFELIISGGDNDNIAQAIRDNMAAGDTSYGGVNANKATGSAVLTNGQAFTVEFSRPSPLDIYVETSIEVTDSFVGEEAVRNQIARYIGGLLSSGQEVTGLSVGEDLIFGEVEYAIRGVEGVHDITGLKVGTSDPPSNTSNISIPTTDVAKANASDGSYWSIGTTEVSN